MTPMNKFKVKNDPKMMKMTNNTVHVEAVFINGLLGLPMELTKVNSMLTTDSTYFPSHIA